MVTFWIVHPCVEHSKPYVPSNTLFDHLIHSIFSSIGICSESDIRNTMCVRGLRVRTSPKTLMHRNSPSRFTTPVPLNIRLTVYIQKLIHTCELRFWPTVLVLSASCWNSKEKLSSPNATARAQRPSWSGRWSPLPCP